MNIKRIVVVEDDLAIQRVLSLARLEGAEGAHEMNRETVSCRQLGERVHALVRLKAKTLGVTVALEAEDLTVFGFSLAKRTARP